MIYTTTDIALITNAETSDSTELSVDHLLLDSRKIYSPASSVFFALKGFRRNGHQFIPELFTKGVRAFIVSENIVIADYPGCVFLFVKDTLVALQQLAAYHRKQFTIPVIGITGSNGKTIVKEWLYQLLHEDYNIVRSPKSYNSQIGVPLSIWQINEHHTLGIFEAGISQPGEMTKLEKIIQPSIGVFTNIGEAHSEGFDSLQQKEKEKKILFKNAVLPASLDIVEINSSIEKTTISARKRHELTPVLSIEIPFSDAASIQNAITCWQVMLHLGYDNKLIQTRMKNLMPVNMRLELKKGINHCLIINDSYSADLSSLLIALNFLDQQSAGGKKTVVLSDFLQSSLPGEQLYELIMQNLEKHQVEKLIGIGENISLHLQANKSSLVKTELFSSLSDFLQQFRSSGFKDETILIKGARKFAFEQLVQLLEQKAHQTILEINLNAIVHNLKEFQRLLNPVTKVMAMVKAFAYGSGGAEIAGMLQYHNVDYLGVAYADEGVELRKAGITLPIMVMNPEENAFDAIVEYNLDPEFYSFELLHAFDTFLKKEGMQLFPVHIEIETGMNRLGFATGEIDRLAAVIVSTASFKVQSVFTHLAASEDASQDAFTKVQFELFSEAATQLQKKLGYTILRHIANSAAVIRHPFLQMDMVRLGIGLYGVDSSTTDKLNLQTVATLKSTIAQIKKLKKGESVSYNRKGVVEKDSLIATIRIGYADGYPRRLGNGIGKILVNGKMAPIAGTICMDMFMADITGIPGVKEGDDVIIFGKDLPVQELAKWADTIPYEIMAGISQRVKRVYFEE